MSLLIPATLNARRAAGSNGRTDWTGWSVSG
jgi:hypothetical protein